MKENEWRFIVGSQSHHVLDTVQTRAGATLVSPLPLNISGEAPKPINAPSHIPI